MTFRGVPVVISHTTARSRSVNEESKSRAAPVVATPSIRRNCKGSRCPSVVVMETAEHWNRDDFAGVVVVHRAIRDSLPNTLARSGSVEIANILPGDVVEVLVVEEEHVIEGLAPEAADKSFSNGIHIRRRQYMGNPSRCHRRTVSGCTMARARARWAAPRLRAGSEAGQTS
jgi:hypothetical protein